MIPFAFVYNDGLLLQGNLERILLAVGTAMVGAIHLAASVRGYLFRVLNPSQRLGIFASGLLFIGPGIIMPLAGLATVGVALVPNFFLKRVA